MSSYLSEDAPYIGNLSKMIITTLAERPQKLLLHK
jgi:hypothetical protein